MYNITERMLMPYDVYRDKNTRRTFGVYHVEKKKQIAKNLTHKEAMNLLDDLRKMEGDLSNESSTTR